MSLKAIFQKYTMFTKYKKYTLADISNSGQELLFFFAKNTYWLPSFLTGYMLSLVFYFFTQQPSIHFSKIKKVYL
jgi:hypothetical protein